MNRYEILLNKKPPEQKLFLEFNLYQEQIMKSAMIPADQIRDNSLKDLRKKPGFFNEMINLYPSLIKYGPWTESSTS